MLRDSMVTRPILWFATAYTIVIIVHEAAHAVTSAVLGLETTLYHFWVNIDPANRATAAQRAAFGVAGPLASLSVGLAAWFAYRRGGRSAAALPLLYLAAIGVSNFFGNLMSASFIGDFANVAGWLELPMPWRYTLSALGAMVMCAVIFLAGRELARWTPAGTSRVRGVSIMVVLPAVVGTALIILVNQPVPIPGFAVARVGEAAFWVFGVAGGLLAVRLPAIHNAGRLEVRWRDGAIAISVVLMVRLMALGIPLS